MQLSNFETTIYMLIGLIIGVILHEVMHGFVAYKFGDMTAKNAGRLTLDPIAHIDPFGTLILPGILLVLNLMGMHSFIIGYAKPVPINPFAFRKRSAIIWVSLAGPLTNLAIALVFLGVARITYDVGGLGDYFRHVSPTVFRMFVAFLYIFYINVLLFVFNLIPIPPLDGSRVVGYFLKGNARNVYRSMEPYGIFIILIFLSLFSVVFTSLTSNFANLLLSALGLPKVF
jgi:Zn-dependent protease